MPFFPIPPILGIVLNILLAIFLAYRDPLTGGIAVIWIILGVISYKLLKKTGWGGVS
jgi:hypothetical protein